MTNHEYRPDGATGDGAQSAPGAPIAPGPESPHNPQIAPGPKSSHDPQIEPWLREILRCPQCRSTLSDGVGPTGAELHCTNAECQLAYRVDDGIPVLLVDESRSLAS